jgi:hypothetical protein
MAMCFRLTSAPMVATITPRKGKGSLVHFLPVVVAYFYRKIHENKRNKSYA